MQINVEKFKIALILNNNQKIKAWALENDFDVDRLRNVLRGLVEPTDEEIKKIVGFYTGGLQ